MPGTPMPYIRIQEFTNAGAPAAAYQLFVYEPGSTTKRDTYSDSALTVLNTNPVVLDSAGTAVVFLDSTLSYKFVLATDTAADPPAGGDIIWTRDNIAAIPGQNISLDVSGVAGEALAATEWVYLSQGDGGLTSGRWYKTDADLGYASSAAGAIGCVQTTLAGAGDTISVRIEGRVTGLSGLTAGNDYYLSATAGAIGAAPASNIRVIGVADTTTSLILSEWAITRFASGLYPGIVSLEAQSFAGAKTFSSAKVAYYAGGVDHAYASGVLDSQVSTLGTGTVGADETTLFTYTLPGGTMAANAAGTALPVLRVTWRCQFAADADVKLLKLYFGATALTVVNLAVNLAGSNGRFTGIIQRVSGSIQRMFADGIVSTATAAAGAGYVFAAAASPAENLANDIVIKVTGQNTTDASDNAIVATVWLVEAVG